MANLSDIRKPSQQVPEYIENYYEIGEFIGRGGVSSVYAAEEDQTGQTRAVKFYDPDIRFVNNGRLLLRFKIEQWAAQRFLFRNLLYGAPGYCDGYLYIKYILKAVSDYKKIIRSDRKLPSTRDCFSFASKLITAVSFMHANGFLHRDLKPSNLLNHCSDIIISDYGVIRDISKIEVDETQTRDLVGSRDYIAPEQRKNPRNVTYASDLYSIGVIIYEFATGQLPTYKMTPIGQLNAEAAFLRNVVEKMLDYNPAKRPQSAKDAWNEIFFSFLHKKEDSSVSGDLMPFSAMKALKLCEILIDTQSDNGSQYGGWEYYTHNIEDLLAFPVYWIGAKYQKILPVKAPTLKTFSKVNYGRLQPTKRFGDNQIAPVRRTISELKSVYEKQYEYNKVKPKDLNNILVLDPYGRV